MEAQRENLGSLYRHPFHHLLQWRKKIQASHDQQRISKRSGLYHYTHQFFLILLLLHVLGSLHLVSSQSWDGIIITQSDFQALQAFKQDLVDPKGFLRSWNDSGYGACAGKWAGIKCAKGEVIVIQLPWKGLSGKITDKIGQFQSLRKLSLHDNGIAGSIPASLGLLPDLRGLQLFNNRLSGSIPGSIGLCRLLQTVDISGNSLSGSIPASLFNSSTKLLSLNLGNNHLSGPIPTGFTPFPTIVFLDFKNNNLSGPIPESISRLRKLSVLDFSGNNFAGEIPKSLDNLSNLNLFNVSYNNLSGRVPTRLAHKFNPRSFLGNPRLCGYSTSTPCPTTITPSPSPETRKDHKKYRLGIKDIILIAAGALLVILLLICCILIWLLFKKRSEKEKGAGDSGKKGIPPAVGKGEAAEAAAEGGGKLVHFDGPLGFAADDLLCATAEVMGKSTYGTAYKATLEDGSEVAVKRLREKITKSQRDFESEVNVLGKIRHPNLLALRAYYLGPKGEKLLVFDFMPKGSLTTCLHARGPDTSLDWAARMRIAKGIARGLLFLHTNANIIHGNLTSSNVLLDETMTAKVADYGLSRLMSAAANANVVATASALGYRAPELSKLKKANAKTDVYALGVIVLELLTGKSPVNGGGGMELPQWVASIVKEEWTNEVFDMELMRDASPSVGDELLNALKLALHCVDPSPSARPGIQQVLQQLEEIRMETGPTGLDDDEENTRPSSD
ncbi:unnamed protein product [Cuscuta campestris]|uniref:Protein kinase domain-containing protein n=1 Tax=Cuscuta campestris TaxID=132261 RepID=A0A484NE36_9ASTE|nr:unnamed protein product [Cuscuta campestris]